MIKKIFNWWWKETKYLFKNEDGFWAALAAIAAALSAMVSGYSAYAQGQAQARMASYNALIARQNADLALKKQELVKYKTRIMEKQFRAKTKRFVGAQKTLYGKAGVTGRGTPLLVMSATAAEAELDALAIRYAGSVEEANIIAERAGYMQEEHLAGMRGRAYKAAGYFGAGKELLSGLSQFAKYKGGK